MPRNGSGVATQPPNTRGGPANTPISSTKYNSVVDDIYQLMNDALPITAGGTGGSSVQSAQAGLSVDNKAVYATKSGNYTAVAADNNSIIRFTATATLSLTAAVTLGANWHYAVIADGGDVTIDPNASETINGLITLVVPNGTSATIICDGTNFFVSSKTNFWEPIASLAFSGGSTFDQPNLAAFRKIKISLTVYPSVNGSIFLRLSEDNGATYLAGASDYLAQAISAVVSSAAASASNASAIQLTNGANQDNNANSPLVTEIILENFNKALFTNVNWAGGGISTGTPYWASGHGWMSRSFISNALRILPGSGGTLTGYITIDGIKG